MENENLEKNFKNTNTPKKAGKKTLIIIIILFAILSIFGYIYFSRTYKQDQNNNKPEIKDEENENNKVENNEDIKEDSDEKEDIPNNNEEDDSSVENDDLKLYFSGKSEEERVFWDDYYIKIDIQDIKQLKLQEDEVSSIEWLSENEIVNLMKQDKFFKNHYEEFEILLRCLNNG